MVEISTTVFDSAKRIAGNPPAYETLVSIIDGFETLEFKIRKGPQGLEPLEAYLTTKWDYVQGNAPQMLYIAALERVAAKQGVEEIDDQSYEVVAGKQAAIRREIDAIRKESLKGWKKRGDVMIKKLPPEGMDEEKLGTLRAEISALALASISSPDDARHLIALNRGFSNVYVNAGQLEMPAALYDKMQEQVGRPRE